MDESKTYQQMQDEMSRNEFEVTTFEAEICGIEMPRAVIGAGTYGAVAQRLERVPPPPPPPQNIPHFELAARMMFPTVPPPPPPPSMMVPTSVQRMRPSGAPDGYGPAPGPGSGPAPLLRGPLPGPLPGPQAAPPPPRPQPVVLSAAPKLYKKPKDEDRRDKTESRKRKRSPEPVGPAAPLSPPPPPVLSAPTPAPAPAPALTPAPAPPAAAETAAPKTKKEKKSRKVVRTAGGQVWEDVTLLDWPDDDFRMFCGDLGNDVTDELLTRTFGKYASFQKAKVIRDKRTNKSKGFGFVSFKDPGDFIKAMKEMDGRYVGSRPIKLRKSSWRNRSLDVVRKKEKEKAALLTLFMSGNKS